MVFSLGFTFKCFSRLFRKDDLYFHRDSEAETHLCLEGFVDTSSSRRQASSSWARVLGGGSGGIAGSWMKGWAGWWLRRRAELPPPPHMCAGPPPKDFLVIWALKRGEEEGLADLTMGIVLQNHGQGPQSEGCVFAARSPVRPVFALPLAL